jgi:hypothetical protein
VGGANASGQDRAYRCCGLTGFVRTRRLMACACATPPVWASPCGRDSCPFPPVWLPPPPPLPPLTCLRRIRRAFSDGVLDPRLYSVGGIVLPAVACGRRKVVKNRVGAMSVLRKLGNVWAHTLLTFLTKSLWTRRAAPLKASGGRKNKQQRPRTHTTHILALSLSREPRAACSRYQSHGRWEAGPGSIGFGRQSHRQQQQQQWL